MNTTLLDPSGTIAEIVTLGRGAWHRRGRGTELLTELLSTTQSPEVLLALLEQCHLDREELTALAEKQELTPALMSEFGKSWGSRFSDDNNADLLARLKSTNHAAYISALCVKNWWFSDERFPPFRPYSSIGLTDLDYGRILSRILELPSSHVESLELVVEVYEYAGSIAENDEFENLVNLAIAL